MKKRALVGTMALCLVLLMVNLSFAAIRTVCATGCGYTSIQAAVNAAVPGDTIQVAAGYYYENVLVDKPGLIIQGADRLKTFVWAEGGHAFEVVAPQVEISGFTIRGGVGDQNYGDCGVFINGGGGPGAPVKNNAPSRNVPASNTGAFGAWIHDNIIEQSTIGIMVLYSSEVRINSNHVRNNTAWDETCLSGMGIVIAGDNVDMFNIKITGNTVYDNDFYGVFVTTCLDYYFEEYCYWTPEKQHQHRAPVDGNGCSDEFDGMLVASNRLYNNGSWDLYAPYDQNSAGFFFHTHDSRITFTNNQILGAPGCDGPRGSVSANGRRCNSWVEDDGYAYYDCWQWSGNTIFREMFPVLRGAVRKMERPVDEDK